MCWIRSEDKMVFYIERFDPRVCRVFAFDMETAYFCSCIDHSCGSIFHVKTA